MKVLGIVCSPRKGGNIVYINGCNENTSINRGRTRLQETVAVVCR